MRHRRRHVGRDRVRARPLDVRHVFELVVAHAHAGRPTEVIERRRMDPGLGEAHGEVLVEGVQTADVGEDDDRRPSGLLGGGRVGREPGAVGGGQEEVTPVGRARSTGDRRKRRTRARLVAHVPGFYAGRPP